MSVQRLGGEVITHYFSGTLRGILAGAGLCKAIQADEHGHIPLILMFPSAYAGYQGYKNKDLVAAWIRENVPTKRGFF